MALAPAGEFHASYRADMTIFPTKNSRRTLMLGIFLLCFAPLVCGRYELGLLINIGFLGIAALGLNILVGFTGQISIGHAAFFGVGAFLSAYLHERFHIPVILCIPLAGLGTAVVGLVFGLPAARLKGLYLAIATLAAQFILEDFFARTQWFTGGVAGRMTEAVELFGVRFDREESYFYVVLVFTIIMFVMAANLMRTRDGRALIAVRDHYLSAEVMGINLAYHRTMSFAISSFHAGIGGRCTRITCFSSASRRSTSCSPSSSWPWSSSAVWAA